MQSLKSALVTGKAELDKLSQMNKALEKQLSELVDENVKLRESNLMLQGKCETLLEDLSVKEARWSEKEDMLHSEVSWFYHSTHCIMHM